MVPVRGTLGLPPGPHATCTLLCARSLGAWPLAFGGSAGEAGPSGSPCGCALVPRPSWRPQRLPCPAAPSPASLPVQALGARPPWQISLSLAHPANSPALTPFAHPLSIPSAPCWDLRKLWGPRGAWAQGSEGQEPAPMPITPGKLKWEVARVWFVSPMPILQSQVGQAPGVALDGCAGHALYTSKGVIYTIV